MDPRSLEAHDPPAWGPAPPGSTSLARRCHEARAKPIDELSVEDLRLLIGQRIALPLLVPLALTHLALDPLVEGDSFPGDLLANVLRIGSDLWDASRTLRTRIDRIVVALAADSGRLATVVPDLRKQIAALNTHAPAHTR